MKKIIIVIVLGLLCLSVAHDVRASAAGKDIYNIMVELMELKPCNNMQQQ